jgi:MarR family transcriptional regulator, transcriptional regulator for hemolysin
MSDSSAFKHKKPDDSAGFLLWKITALWQQKLSIVFDKFNINQTQFAILASLKWFEEHEESMTQTHIVEHAKIEKMTVSKSVRKLEKKSFIIREKSTLDTRVLNIRFTPLGKSIINDAIVAIENTDEQFFSVLSTHELKAYKSLTLALINRQ